MRICDPCSDLILFSFIFDQGRCVPKYSSDSIASQKSKKKQADCRICLS
jgi:hypothetical protein